MKPEIQTHAETPETDAIYKGEALSPEPVAKPRIPLVKAMKLAAELLDLLAPACERIEICGSIRRMKETIGDIELVIIPRIISEKTGLLAEFPEAVNKLNEAVEIMVRRGILSHRLDVGGKRACGDRFKRMLFKDFAADLFVVLPPAQFGMIKLIRTGSADFSHRFVTPHWQGGTLPMGYEVKDGALWKAGRMVSTPEEIDVFNALDRLYVKPEERI